MYVNNMNTILYLIFLKKISLPINLNIPRYKSNFKVRNW